MGPHRCLHKGVRLTGGHFWSVLESDQHTRGGQEGATALSWAGVVVWQAWPTQHSMVQVNLMGSHLPPRVSGGLWEGSSGLSPGVGPLSLVTCSLAPKERRGFRLLGYIQRDFLPGDPHAATMVPQFLPVWCNSPPAEAAEGSTIVFSTPKLNKTLPSHFFFFNNVVFLNKNREFHFFHRLLTMSCP